MHKSSILLILFILIFSCKKTSVNKTYKIKSITTINSGSINKIIEFTYDKNNLLTQVVSKIPYLNSSKIVKFEYDENKILEKINFDLYEATLKYDSDKIFVTKVSKDGEFTWDITLNLTEKNIPYKITSKMRNVNSIIQGHEATNNGESQCMKMYNSGKSTCEWILLKDNVTINPLFNHKEVLFYNWIFTVGNIREADFEYKLWGFDTTFTPISIEEGDIFKIEYARDQNNFPKKAFLTHLNSNYKEEYIFEYF